jgi:hypothetical protein
LEIEGGWGVGGCNLYVDEKVRPHGTKEVKHGAVIVLPEQAG